MPVTKQVFLHMGAHKTGTTTLQADLASNRDALSRCGLIYPDFNKANSHFQWARFLAGEMPNISAVQHQQLTAEWLDGLQAGQALLLSAESFYRHINTQGDYLVKLRSVLDGADITPVLCLRRQADYAKSLYGEWVMNWQYPHDIYTFIQEFYGWFDFERVVKQVSLLGRPLLISYHQIAGKALTENFLRHLGYNATLSLQSKALRVSVSDAEIYLKRLLNTRYPQNKFRAVVADTVKHFVHVKYTELASPMPALIWHGVLQPAIFERSFNMANMRLAKQFDLEYSTFFSAEQATVLKPVSAEKRSLLTRVYAELEQALSENILAHKYEES